MGVEIWAFLWFAEEITEEEGARVQGRKFIFEKTFVFKIFFDFGLFDRFFDIVWRKWIEICLKVSRETTPKPEKTIATRKSSVSRVEELKVESRRSSLITTEETVNLGVFFPQDQDFYSIFHFFIYFFLIKIVVLLARRSLRMEVRSPVDEVPSKRYKKSKKWFCSKFQGILTLCWIIGFKNKHNWLGKYQKKKRKENLRSSKMPEILIFLIFTFLFGNYSIFWKILNFLLFYFLVSWKRNPGARVDVLPLWRERHRSLKRWENSKIISSQIENSQAFQRVFKKTKNLCCKIVQKESSIKGKAAEKIEDKNKVKRFGIARKYDRVLVRSKLPRNFL